MDTSDDTESVKLDGVDYGIAVFLLVFSVVFLVVSAAAIALFYRERNAFEIRARSAYLVMLTALSFMIMIATVMVYHAEGVTGREKNVFVKTTIKYFTMVCSTCCYGSRTIRLMLQCNPRARKAAPWLLPERNHVVVCILLGLAAMIAPLYDMAVVGDPDSGETQQDVEDEFVEVADEHLWIISLTSKIFVIAINPLTWSVDDIFNLRRELRVFSSVLFIQLVGAKAVAGKDLSVTRWIDERNLEFFAAIIMFSLSVIHPIKQRLLHPMQPTDRKRMEALHRRKKKVTPWIGEALRSASGGRLFWSEKDSDSVTAIEVDDGDANSVGVASSSTSPGSMTYETVMSMPKVSVAFEDFSRKALCQESIFFLKDVMIYESQAFSPDEEKGDGGVGGGGAEDGDGAQDKQFRVLSHMVREYILDGSPNEVNLSSKDKKNIVEVYKLGETGFRAMPEMRRRCVFAEAYSEIRFMLESNLMRKFVATDGFKEALAADQSNHPSYAQ